MNKKAFKVLIVSKDGEIIKRGFKYKNVVYPFYYFIKDSKQWTNWITRSDMKRNYKNDLIQCSKYGIINDRYYKKDKKSNYQDGTGWLGIFWIAILIILGIFNFCLNFILSYKNKYVDLDTRIKELKLWSTVFTVDIKKKELIQENAYYSWAFEKIILNDYAKRKNKDDILTIDNYIALKNAQNDEENNKKREKIWKDVLKNEKHSKHSKKSL